MTAHKVRVKRLARGAKIATKGTRGGSKLVRCMGSFDPADWALIEFLAKKRGTPVAQVLRDAVWAYVLPLKNNPGLKDAVPK